MTRRREFFVEQLDCQGQLNHFFVERVRYPGVWQLWLSLNEIGWCESVQNKWSGIDLNISPTCNQQSNCELRGFAQYIAVSLMRISICTHLLYEAMQNESTELCSISHVCSLYFPWKVYCSVYIAVKPVEVLLSGNLYILPAGGCGLEAIRSTHHWYFN